MLSRLRYQGMSWIPQKEKERERERGGQRETNMTAQKEFMSLLHTQSVGHNENNLSWECITRNMTLDIIYPQGSCLLCFLCFFSFCRNCASVNQEKEESFLQVTFSKLLRWICVSWDGRSLTFYGRIQKHLSSLSGMRFLTLCVQAFKSDFSIDFMIKLGNHRSLSFGNASCKIVLLLQSVQYAYFSVRGSP